MLALAIFFCGLFAWFFATLTAGGAGVLYLALASLLVPVPLATVTLGIAGTLTGLYRAWIYRLDFNKPILRWLLPGTVLGAVSGAALFGVILATRGVVWLQGFLAVFLILTGVSGLLRTRNEGKVSGVFWFFPAGLLTGFISGVVGAAGPMLNGMFQKFSLSPQQIVGIKSLNILVQQMTKSLVYLLTIQLATHEVVMDASLSMRDVILFSAVAAIGGSLGVYAGRKILARVRSDVFNIMLNLMMVAYGASLACKVLGVG